MRHRRTPAEEGKQQSQELFRSRLDGMIDCPVAPVGEAQRQDALGCHHGTCRQGVATDADGSRPSLIAGAFDGGAAVSEACVQRIG